MNRPAFTALQLGPYHKKVRMPAFADGVRALGGAVVEIADSKAEVLRALLARRDEGSGIGNQSPNTNLNSPRVTTRPWFAFTAGWHEREAAARGILRVCGIPLLVTDLGYLRRAPSPASLEGYYQVGIGCLCWLPGEDEWEQGAGGREQGPVSSAFGSRPWAEARLRALQVEITERVDPESRPAVVLVLGQKPNDGQHGMDSPALQSWLTDAAAEYFARGWKVLVRPHPRYTELKLGLPHEMCSVNEPLAAQFARVREVVTINSTAGVEALIAGLPVRSHEMAHYHALGRNPGVALLRSHLRRLACAQWTIEELRRGDALRFMSRWLPRLAGTEGMGTGDRRERGEEEAKNACSALSAASCAA